MVDEGRGDALVGDIEQLVHAAQQPILVDGVPVFRTRIITRDDARRVDVVKEELGVVDVERHLAHPRRKRGEIVMRTPGAFVDYVNAHKGPGTAIYAAPGAVLTCVLDDHAPGVDGPAGWGEHVVVLRQELHYSWSAWMRANGTWLSQAQLAEFLEDRLPEIAAPEGAVMHELSRQFEATRKVAYQSGRRLDNGQVNLTYAEELEGGSSRGNVVVPTEFTLVLRRFRHSFPPDSTPATWSGKARLRWRLRGTEVEFCFILPEELRDWTELADEQLAYEVAIATGVPVYEGGRSSGGA